MRDAHIAKPAAEQFNRVSRRQLVELGLSDAAIAHRVAAGRLVIVEQGVFAVAPVLEHDEWGCWMGATLTAPDSVLCRFSAAAAWGFWSLPRAYETVARPGNGGPRRHGGLMVFRSSTPAGDSELLRGIAVTSVARTLLDLSAHASERALARSVREALRLQVTTVGALVERLGGARGRRGSRRLARALARYAGLPLERARSGAEVRALEVLRDGGFRLPRVNVWAGWTVRRISSDDVYECPQLLLALSESANVPRCPA